MARRFEPLFEAMESRVLSTLVFILNGNAFAETRPNGLTQAAANALNRDGHRTIQLATPAMNGPGSFAQLANQIKQMSHGRPIGLVGFSAGGALSLRLAGVSGLNVKSVLNLYGPPDLRLWLGEHRGDTIYRQMTDHVRLTSRFIDLMSGPGTARTHLVSAFGTQDASVRNLSSQSSFLEDFPEGKVYAYRGGHGVGLLACPAAYRDFLSAL